MPIPNSMPGYNDIRLIRDEIGLIQNDLDLKDHSEKLWANEKYPKFIDNGPIYPSDFVASFTNLGGGLVLAGASMHGPIHRSTDWGRSWYQVKGIGTRCFNACNLGGGIIIAGDISGHIWRSVDFGFTWTDLGNVANGNNVSTIVYCGNGICVLGTRDTGRVYRSINYGENWSYIGQPVAGAWDIYALCYLGNGVVIFGTGFNGHVARSTDSGEHWDDMGVLIDGESEIKASIYLGNGISLMGSSTNGKIARSVDFGLNWSDLGAIGGITKLYSFANLGKGVVLAGGNEYIAKSLDYGVTWTSLGIPFNGIGNINGLCYLGNGITIIGGSKTGYSDSLQDVYNFNRQRTQIKSLTDRQISVNATSASETNVLLLENALYTVENLRLKCVDPGADTVTVKLYEMVNTTLTLVDSFDITTANYATYFTLWDMFNVHMLRGLSLKVTVRASAGGPYAVTGSASVRRE